MGAGTTAGNASQLMSMSGTINGTNDLSLSQSQFED
jgi:hypothetical protein